MGLSVRLDKSIEEMLRQRLRSEGVSLSDFIREAIREKLARTEEEPDPFVLGEALFGCFASGRDDLSVNRKRLLREKLHAQHRR